MSALGTNLSASARIRGGIPIKACLAAAVVLLIGAAVALPARSAAAASEPRSLDVASIDEYVQGRLAGTAIPGAAIAMTRGDEVIHIRGYGHDSRGGAVTGETPFRIASLSKSFTALAVMQLVDAGRVTLDDTVVSHLPEFHPADPRGAAITVRELLDQTSGLADREVHDLSRTQPRTLAEATEMLSTAHLVAAPGSEFNYHNPNYQVAARLVEVVSGETFADYLQGHVFAPAGMGHSVTTNTDTEPVDGLANGHVIAYRTAIALPAPGDFAGGAGGVVSTAADMAQWLIVQGNAGASADGSRIVSAASMSEMHGASAPNGYALGWDTVGPARTPTRLEHNGSVLTFSAFEAIIPSSGYGLAIMFNSSSGLLTDQMSIYYGILNLIEGTPPASPAPARSAAALDGVFALFTLLVLLLGSRSAARSGRWARRTETSAVRIVVGLVGPVTAVAFVAAVPKIAGSLIGGRDLTWVTVAYGSPALAVLALAILGTALATLATRLWRLGRGAGFRSAGLRPHAVRMFNRRDSRAPRLLSR